MKHVIGATLVGFACLVPFLAAWQESPQPTPAEVLEQVKQYRDRVAEKVAEPPAQRYLVENVVVVDGDTVGGDVLLPFNITLRDQRIRFLNVDTWETRGAERPLGLLAKEYTAARLRDNVLWIVPTGKRQRDNFGRILAHPYIQTKDGWVDLPAALIANRHGRKPKGGD